VVLFAGEIPPSCVVLSTPSEDDHSLPLELICSVQRDITTARTTFPGSSSAQFPFVSICLSAQLWLWTALNGRDRGGCVSLLRCARLSFMENFEIFPVVDDHMKYILIEVLQIPA
jgi:hypothetical protein